MTEIFSQLHPQLKVVNMYLGQFQWPHLVDFPSKFKIVYHHFGREKKKKKKVCKSFKKKIFQRDEIGHKAELL